jgi:hypothetical protein
VQYLGPVTRKTFDRIADYMIEHYFKHPSYWLLDGRPYFSIYELGDLMKGLGGIARTRKALDDLRAKTKAAGFPDLHLNAVLWSVRIPPGQKSLKDPAELLASLGFDSIGSYVWIHHARLTEFPKTPYRDVMEKVVAHWHETLAKFRLPYHPNVTMGWDSSPRTVQSDRFLNAGYPFMPTLSGNTPEAFKEALIRVKEFLHRQGSPSNIFTINAWNEWTEGSYLEPDTVYGTAYLQAIKDVFGK